MVIAQIVFSEEVAIQKRSSWPEQADLLNSMTCGLAHFHVIQGDNELKGKPIFLKKKKLAVIESLFCALPVYSFHSFVQ